MFSNLNINKVDVYVVDLIKFLQGNDTIEK